LIELVVGTLGTGKTFHVLRRSADALRRGQIVVTNVELAPDWPRRMAGRKMTRDKQQRIEAMYRRNMHMVPTFDEAMRMRLPRCGKCKRCREGRPYCGRENRGLLIWDEAHNRLNARTWEEDNRKRQVDFLTLTRKYGWHVVLVTHAPEQIDAQVRRLVENTTHLRNLRRLKVWGVTVFPFNFFVAVTCWNDRHKTILKRSWYRLDKTLADSYESMAVPEDADQAVDVILLPIDDPAAQLVAGGEGQPGGVGLAGEAPPPGGPAATAMPLTAPGSSGAASAASGRTPEQD
jgi:hypothetical protein